MAAFEKLIDKLQKRKVQEATEGLQTPKTRDAFELGRLSGIQQGLAIAGNLIEEVLNEDEQPQSTSVRKR